MRWAVLVIVNCTTKSDLVVQVCELLNERLFVYNDGVSFVLSFTLLVRHRGLVAKSLCKISDLDFELYAEFHPMCDDSLLEGLSQSEKLGLVTSLWDQISCSGDTLSVLNMVLDNSSQRIKEMKVDTNASLAADEMWRQAN